MPATVLGRLAWHYLINGGWQQVAGEYVFDTRVLTNDQPYFAAYIKVKDLLKFTDRLELVQDEWGYLLLWATLGIAALFAFTLVLFPLIFGWRTIFSRYPGKFGTHDLFRLPGAGLHHRRGGHDLPLHPGAFQRHGVGLGADHRHAGLLRPRQLLLRALSSTARAA